MRKIVRNSLLAGIGLLSIGILWVNGGSSEGQERRPDRESQRPNDSASSPDAAERAQSVKETSKTRPEQELGDHDKGDRFKEKHAKPISPALADQPMEGKITGFDFYRDPLNAPKPMTTFQEIYE